MAHAGPPNDPAVCDSLLPAYIFYPGVFVVWIRWPGIRVMTPYLPVFMSKQCDALPACTGFMSSAPAWLLSVGQRRRGHCCCQWDCSCN